MTTTGVSEANGGSQEVPVLHYKCVEEYSDDGWFDVGKLYPVDKGFVYDNGAYGWSEADIRSGITDAEFQLVWLLPDGTELEALE